jgi:hypothetical protein
MALAGEGMKNFLIRLFNLEKLECPSCKVYKEWIERVQLNHSVVIGAFNHQLSETSDKLEAAYERLHQDKEAERLERQTLEDTILKHTRIRGTTGPQEPTPAVNSVKLPMRPGTAWNRMKFNLEDEARKKAEGFKKQEQQEISAGRMAKSENIRESPEGPI